MEAKYNLNQVMRWLFMIVIFAKLQSRLAIPLFEDNVIIAYIYIDMLI